MGHEHEGHDHDHDRERDHDRHSAPVVVNVNLSCCRQGPTAEEWKEFEARVRVQVHELRQSRLQLGAAVQAANRQGVERS